MVYSCGLLFLLVPGASAFGGVVFILFIRVFFFTYLSLHLHTAFSRLFVALSLEDYGCSCQVLGDKANLDHLNRTSGIQLWSADAAHAKDEPLWLACFLRVPLSQVSTQTTRVPTGPHLVGPDFQHLAPRHARLSNLCLVFLSLNDLPRVSKCLTGKKLPKAGRTPDGPASAGIRSIYSSFSCQLSEHLYKDPFFSPWFLRCPLWQGQEKEPNPPALKAESIGYVFKK